MELIILIVGVAWIAVSAVVVGLCAAAARGDAALMLTADRRLAESPLHSSRSRAQCFLAARPSPWTDRRSPAPDRSR